MRPAKRKTTSEREKPKKRGEDAIKGVTKPTTKGGGKGDDGVQAGRDKGVQANHTHFFFFNNPFLPLIIHLNDF